ncbi:hypothetical protein ACLO87_05950 [Paenalcaligenes sp. Me52]|uniref:hypothetical protein n=1 Tax=Paenalcaligenes sp. Me52 TaxID=3392038 RepID=UPI003D2DFE3D
MLLRALPLLLLFPTASQVSAQPPTTAAHQYSTNNDTAVVTSPSPTDKNSWITGRSVDPYTGQSFPYASLQSSSTTLRNPVILTLLCSRYQTIVNLYWGQPLAGERMTIRYITTPANETVEENWEVSSDQRTLIYPSDGNQLFASLLNAPIITIEAQAENGPLWVASFTTQGADTALNELIKVCGE